MIIDQRRLDDAAEVIRTEDFYSDANRVIWGRLVAMDAAGKTIDGQLLADALKASGEFEAVGGAAYLLDVMRAAAIPQHAKYYAQVVARTSRYRRLITAGADLLRSAYAASEEPEAILDETERQLTAISTESWKKEPLTMESAILEAMAAIDAARDRKSHVDVMTGLGTFDRHIGGLFPGELNILAARPRVGKTSMACQIAVHCAQHGRPVLFVSLEMSGRELASRIMAGISGVGSKAIRTAELSSEDHAKIAEAGRQIAELPIRIDDRPSATVYGIRRTARRMARKGLGLIVVDYLQRVTPSDRRAQRYEAVGQMTRELKELARELNVPILCLAQAGRESERDPQPKLSHLRESGDIEADADVVLFITVEEPTDGQTESDEREAKLHVLKNRNGITGDIPLWWIPRRTRFLCEEASDSPRSR